VKGARDAVGRLCEVGREMDGDEEEEAGEEGAGGRDERHGARAGRRAS